MKNKTAIGSLTKYVNSLQGHLGGINDVATLSLGRFVSAGKDGSVRVWQELSTP